MYWSEPSSGSIHRIEGRTGYKEVVYNATRVIEFIDIQVSGGVVYYRGLHEKLARPTIALTESFNCYKIFKNKFHKLLSI